MIEMSLTHGPALQALTGVHRDTGIAMHVLTVEQTALWAKDLVRQTVPNRRLGGYGMTDRQIGHNAVQNDLEKIFEPINDPAVLMDYERGPSQGGVIYRMSKRGLMKIDRALLHRSVAQWHRDHQNKRTGRTFIAKMDRTMAWGGKMPADARSLATYAKKVKDDVGRTKAGWIPALRILSAQSKGAVSAVIPNYGWVFRHDKGEGTGNSVFNRATISGYAFAENSVPWISRWDRGLLASTYRTRLADVRGPHYPKRLQRIMNKYQGVAA